jgi:amidohydrolase
MSKFLCGLAGALLMSTAPAMAQPTAPRLSSAALDKAAAGIEPKLIEWRRQLHQHPELSNREEKTAEFVAAQLRSFGLEPRTGIARHGVTAVLKGGKPGPVVALRADMDGLPVTEQTGLPFASQAKGEYEGKPVGVMHACGHDAHVSMLLAAAKVLTDLRAELPGSVVFIFQPAEEGAPQGETPAGAEAMVAAGVLTSPAVNAIFGLHVFANLPTGHIAWRSGPKMAAADRFEIIVRGRQTHGAVPWAGVDPIVVGSQIVLGLQTIVSRQVDITKQPAIVTVGQFEAGTRNNIIPDSARLVGTIRTFDAAMQTQIHEAVRRTATQIAGAMSATADVTIERGVPVTVNDPELTAQMLPTIKRVAGAGAVEGALNTAAEDFSYFQQQVPGLFIFLGITPPDEVGKAAHNHSPLFKIDEAALVTGVRALTHLTVDYMNNHGASRAAGAK